MLIRDGFNKGVEPTLSVLEVSTNKKRGPSDLLPYLGQFAHLFAQLPQTFKTLSLRVTTVAISEVECVTETLIKSENTIFKTLGNKEEAQKLAEDQFIPLVKSWTYRDWEETNWRKIKDLSLQNILDAREKAAAEAQNRKCIDCPKFLQHFTMQHDEWLVKENIAQLRQLMSDQNLQLLPDYEQRISVLKELGFVDESSRVELKGKVACEVHTADELVLTELVLENVLADYEPEEIVALLSSFVFQEKTDTEPTLTAKLEKGKAKIIEISERVNKVQTIHQVIESTEDANDFVSKPRFGMVEVVYEWARGMSFNRITDLTDVMEGTIVRVITRLDETCREVKNAARIVGDPELFVKMGVCQEMIKRDVCATASLYM